MLLSTKRHVLSFASFSPALLSLLLAPACSPQQTGAERNTSKTSQFILGEFKGTDANGKTYDKMNITIRREGEEAPFKSVDFKRSEFAEGSVQDRSFKLSYGKYLFDLKYYAADGKTVLFQSCDPSLVHTIQVPSYKKSIPICKGTTDVAAGNTELDPGSDIQLDPVLGNSDNGNSNGSSTQTGQEIVAYYQTWSAKYAGVGKDMDLAKLPSYITTVLISFVRPDMTYTAGQGSFAGTGLDFSMDFAVVKDAIKELKSKNPKTKVILSVGGATFTNWSSPNTQAIAALVRDLGADGADIDYEPTGTTCSWGTGGASCPKDQEFIDIIRSFRSALPRPLMVTTAAWSTGAFGPGKYAVSKMNGNLVGPNFGLYVNPLKTAGDLFDAVYIMSYDAGGPSAPAGTPTAYSPALAFEAYRELYKGPLMLGLEVPPEAWGGHVSTLAEAGERAKFVKEKGGQGMMIWSLHKAGTPTANDFVQTMCRSLGMADCDRTLPAL